MNIKKFLMVNIEGAIVGALWGIISIYTSLGLATLESVALWQKILILPVLLAEMLKLEGMSSIIMTIIIGGFLGILVDMVYKPNQ